MAEPVVIKSCSPVNEGSTGRLLEAVDEELASGVEQFILLISRQQPFADGSEVVSIQAGG